MAGGGVAALGVTKERAAQYRGRVTTYVALACIVAAVGGSIFGYDIGISGGVTSMDPFLMKFFPVVYRRKNSGGKNNYCKYNNQGLSAFTSSLYVAGLVASLAASPVTRNYGRKVSIVSGGLCFLIGAALNAGAQDLAMLLIGRIMLGFGIGFGNQAVPLYLSEMAPAHLRGALNMMFQLATTLGIFTANMINYGTQNLVPWGWRLSLGLAAVPAFIMTVGGLFLPETPNSLIERGHVEEGRRLLIRIRGTDEVEAEFADMTEASELANAVKHPFRNILERRNRPQLVMAIFMPAFQILTGINSILFYAPVLFQSMGFGSNASLYSSVLTGAVLFSSTILSISTVDRLGPPPPPPPPRRPPRPPRPPHQRRHPDDRLPSDRGGDLGGEVRDGQAADEGVLGGRRRRDLPLRAGVRVVVGAAGVDGAERDLPAGDAVGGAEHHRRRQPLLHLHHRPGLPLPPLRLQVRHLSLLRRLDHRHDRLRLRLLAGDQGGAHRGDGAPLEEALVLEEDHAAARRRRRRRRRGRRRPQVIDRSCMFVHV